MLVVLKIPYGLDAGGRLVHVGEAVRGKACRLVCPGCGGRLVAEKGDVRRHYLAHLAGGGSGEGCLHAIAKLLVHQRVQDALDAGAGVLVAWQV